MSNPFFEKSKEIANNFLQSIVFIDDKAYSGITAEDPNHDFDAQKVSMAFAKEKKICGVYQPKSKEDIQDFKVIVKKADVIILDWKIILTDNTVEDPNADADAEDPRGLYTIEILKDIIEDSSLTKESLKLIIIYTGETDLNEITNKIFDELSIIKSGFQKESCQVFSNSIKILVRAKSSVGDDEVDNKFNHLKDFNDKIIKYKDLPSFVLNEFTCMTSGLLSNFVLDSLTTIRENTFKLIALYNKDLDDAFVAHRLFLPNPNDSKDHLIDILSQSIQALLNYNEVGEKSISKEWIEAWIDLKTIETEIEVNKNKISINNDFIKKWSETNFIESVLGIYPDIDKNKAATKLNDLSKSVGSSFIKGSDNKTKDIEFSILTHHKSNLKNQSAIPKLTLGSIILKQGTDGNDEYFLCIQAKCDSVRVTENTRFLFLPLDPVSDGKKFHFIIQDLKGNYLKLNVLKDTYKLKTIKFNPSAKSDCVIADKESLNYFFTSTHGEKLFWICDLKDLHAQRIANLYASQLSRVGLDESEWLRRWAN